MKFVNLYNTKILVFIDQIYQLPFSSPIQEYMKINI